MFTEKTLEFLENNRFENKREWFHSHKDDYEKYVLHPLIELDNYISETITAIDGYIDTTPKVNRAISRIYCDLRYSKGYLFRDSAWLSLKRDKHEFPCFPEFYVVFSPYMFIFGCGYYSASAEVMNFIRQSVINDDKMFLKAKKAFESQNVLSVCGDRYKKSRFPDQSEDKRFWLDLKNISFQYTAKSVDELFDEGIGEKIRAAFESAKDIYDFFIYAEESVLRL